jgi:hypothetical protein
LLRTRGTSQDYTQEERQQRQKKQNRAVGFHEAPFGQNGSGVRNR